MAETAERVSIRLADAYEHQQFLETIKRRVKRGQTVKVEGRKGKVVDLYEDFIVVEFTVYSPIWEFKQDRYKECFLWREVAGLLEATGR